MSKASDSHTPKLTFAEARAAEYPVGAIILDGYWRATSRVLATAIDGDRWSVTVVDCDRDGAAKPGARTRTHCTPFDRRADRVLAVIAN